MVSSGLALMENVLSTGNLVNVQSCLSDITEQLGFTYFTYGLRCPVPISNPRVEMISSYPLAWLERYRQRRYADIDPVVRRSMKSIVPVAWDASQFTEKDFADEAVDHGARHGVAICVRDAHGHMGLLTLARAQDRCSEGELAHIRGEVALMGQLTHAMLSERLMNSSPHLPAQALSSRELEVLKWTAEGKTSAEVAMIMNITERTVNFHISNCVTKLGASNKLHAAVKAAVLGLLNV